jgi:hypothetical protein
LCGKVFPICTGVFLKIDVDSMEYGVGLTTIKVHENSIDVLRQSAKRLPPPKFTATFVWALGHACSD